MASPRIQRRLVLSYVVLLLCALGPAVALLQLWLGGDTQEEIRRDLQRQANLLGEELLRAPPPDILRWIDGVRPHLDARASVIAPDGRVLADTEVPQQDLGRLSNHGDRPEVAEAVRGRVGRDRRRSATLDEEMIYVAVPVGTPPAVRYVLRLSLPLRKVERTVRRVQVAAVLAGCLALALAAGLGMALARYLVRPLVAMTRAARAMTHGDFTAPLPPAPRDELGELNQVLGELRRQLAEHLGALRAEGEKLRAVLNGMTEGVALVQRGQITLANPAFTELLGMAPDAEGMRPLEIAALPELATAVDAAARERREGRREVAVGARTLMMQVRPLGDAPSEQAMVVLLDVTDAKRLERVRRDFAANASHELRTPVAAIVGAAEALAAGAASDPQARSSFLRILERHAQRLRRLTADLLDLSRLEAGYRPRLEAVPLGPALQAVLPPLRARAEEKRIAIAAALPSDLPEVAAERAAVEQILTNLIENAVKYTQPGGAVTISAAQVDGRVRVTVADTGPGIPEEHLPRLFERFYRVDSARSRELGGTGLGLAIVRHLALAHGGDVSVESAVGHGSRFHVTLPLAA